MAYASSFESESTVIDREQEHAFGGSARYLKSTRAERYTAQTVAFDIGYINLWKRTGFRWSLLVKNIGPDMTYKVASEPLPFVIVAGGAWRKNIPALGAEPFIVAAEVDFDRERKKTARAGIEYWMKHMAAVRAGYQRNGVSNAWTLGGGVEVPGFSFKKDGHMRFDYALMLQQNVGSKNIVSFSIDF